MEAFMKVNVCKWKNNADSPFVLMMDDLCNKYMCDTASPGFDWGGIAKGTVAGTVL